MIYLFLFIIFFFIGCVIIFFCFFPLPLGGGGGSTNERPLIGGGVGGLTNERPRTDHVITGPTRGLEKNRIGRGQTHKHTNNRQTLQLLDQRQVGAKVSRGKVWCHWF